MELKPFPYYFVIPRHWILVIRSEEYGIWKNIHPEIHIYKARCYKYINPLKCRRKKIVAIIHIYGARFIFLLFCDHQDTESDYWEMEISVYGKIFTHKNTKRSMVNQYPYSTRWEGNSVSILNIYVDKSIFYYFVFADTLNMCIENVN